MLDPTWYRHEGIQYERCDNRVCISPNNMIDPICLPVYQHVQSLSMGRMIAWEMHHSHRSMPLWSERTIGTWSWTMYRSHPATDSAMNYQAPTAHFRCA